jgi:hypothetical protein
MFIFIFIFSQMTGINGWGTKIQADKGILDEGKYFERDTFLSGEKI